MKPRSKITLAISAVIIISAASALTYKIKEDNKHKYILQQAESGMVKYQLALGERYFNDHDMPQSAYWLGKAAEQGSHEAVDRLGVMAYYLKSKSNPSAEDQQLFTEVEQTLNASRRPQTMLDIYQQRAAEGDMDAVLSLGIMYKRGEGAPQDYAQARNYFERYAASDKTSSPGSGEYYLASLYLAGNGVAVDGVKALALLQKSCDLKFKLSCYQIGDLYYQGGESWAKDYKKATALLDVYSEGKSADSRAVTHIQDLFTMYRDGGHGIQPNPQRIKAIKTQLCRADELYGEDCEGIAQQ
ncbi:tetratricopeptide repeat protein [Erwinia sp. SLM-02]|uniref:tetratricopeptide repeat protein n=1 Tax=Erwinia sp. SLM-02 TaxID=3020057 RepID=UPI003080DF43